MKEKKKKKVAVSSFKKQEDVCKKCGKVDEFYKLMDGLCKTCKQKSMAASMMPAGRR